MTNQIDVFTSYLPEAREALDRLVAKANRFGSEPITYRVGKAYVEKITIDGRRREVSRTPIFVSGSAPRVGNYTFLTRIEHTSAGNILDTVPGQDLPDSDRWRTAAPFCDHCRSRRDRKHTFVCQSDGGQLVQVGRSCLRDFLGIDSPEKIANRFSWIRQIREFCEEFGGSARARADDLLTLLAYTATAIRLYGWIPRSAGETIDTSDIVGKMFFCSAADELGQKRVREMNAARNDGDWVTAQETIDWVNSDAAGSSDYIHNLKVIFAQGLIEPKRRGYAVSAVASYQKHLGRLEARKRENAALAASQFLGTEGERLRNVPVTVLSARGIDTVYGSSIIYKMVTPEGNVISWFSSGAAELDVGKSYRIDATIKSHEVYNGVNQTKITRGKVL